MHLNTEHQDYISYMRKILGLDECKNMYEATRRAVSYTHLITHTLTVRVMLTM